MRVREAKDFLAEQIRQQTAIEDVLPADLEIQILYFTEQDGLSERMQKLSEEFEQIRQQATIEDG